MEYLSPYEPRKKRPTLLTVLAILTFIGSGFFFLTYVIMAFSQDMWPAVIETMQNMGQPDTVIEVYEQFAVIPGTKYLLVAIAHALAIVGAALMLKLNKIGFHIYVASQILLFCVRNFIIGGVLKIGTLGILEIVLFIVLYAINYKYMINPAKAGGADPEEDLPENEQF